MYDTEPGTPDRIPGGGEGSIIRTVYRCRDRSKTINYSYERWGSWSEWSDTKYTASSMRKVETRTVYKYDTDRDRRHVWRVDDCIWNKADGSLTVTYQCAINASHVKTEVIEDPQVLRLPTQLQEIEAEAFAGLACQVVIIPEGCTTIGTRAFADCDELLYVDIPSTVTSIADNAFENCENYLVAE